MALSHGQVRDQLGFNQGGPHKTIAKVSFKFKTSEIYLHKRRIFGLTSQLIGQADIILSKNCSYLAGRIVVSPVALVTS